MSQAPSFPARWGGGSAAKHEAVRWAMRARLIPRKPAPLRISSAGPNHAPIPRNRAPGNLYDACIVLDWNISPRRRGRGSAIFCHGAPGFTPTKVAAICGRRGFLPVRHVLVVKQRHPAGAAIQ